jgi:hypothetical protein
MLFEHHMKTHLLERKVSDMDLLLQILLDSLEILVFVHNSSYYNIIII